ncbi:MAG TPA: flagellar biosynthesis protein FlhF, partial [Xanthomonadaceae bacterium]|nr:flagellar biosynthesis protein FlhF [Xanthomonadaceae bacterium]
MKIKRYYATDMRAALIQVRQEQGPDAVILSNRATADGVEVIAATDYDENLVRSTLKAFAPATTRSEAAPAPAPEPARSRDAA